MHKILLDIKENKKIICIYNNLIKSGAIIGDGDRKRAPFQVLGLSP